MDEAMPIDEATGHRPQATEEEATGHRPEATGPEAVPPEPDPSNPQSPISNSPEPEPEAEAEIDDIPDPAEDLAAHLLDVNVRLWAELGRSRLPLAQTVALGAGAIVDLDKEPDDELDVLVNGLPFAKGRLLLIDGEWAIRLEQIVATPQAVEQASNSASEA